MAPFAVPEPPINSNWLSDTVTAYIQQSLGFPLPSMTRGYGRFCIELPRCHS